MDTEALANSLAESSSRAEKMLNQSEGTVDGTALVDDGLRLYMLSSISLVCANRLEVSILTMLSMPGRTRCLKRRVPIVSSATEPRVEALASRFGASIELAMELCGLVPVTAESGEDKKEEAIDPTT